MNAYAVLHYSSPSLYCNWTPTGMREREWHRHKHTTEQASALVMGDARLASRRRRRQTFAIEALPKALLSSRPSSYLCALAVLATEGSRRALPMTITTTKGRPPYSHRSAFSVSSIGLHARLRRAASDVRQTRRRRGGLRSEMEEWRAATFVGLAFYNLLRSR